MTEIEAVGICFHCQSLFNDIGCAAPSTPCPNCGKGMTFTVAPLVVEAVDAFETEDTNEDY